jgi:hypothetical protein
LSTTQRIASVVERRGFTSTGTWYLERRLHVVDRALQRGERFAARLLLDHLERAVDDLFGGALLAVQHHLVDDLRDERGVVDGISEQFAAYGRTFARHGYLYFERFAP